MRNHTSQKRAQLVEGATVVVIGGGPAGAFFSIHLLRRSRELHRQVKVVVIERRRESPGRNGGRSSAGWTGCNSCAGGLSPRLNDVLHRLNLQVPDEVIQSRIHSITVQGYWKNIELQVPDGREMLSVFRGVRPAPRPGRQHNFDAVLLERALAEGAELLSGEVVDAEYPEGGRPVVRYRAEGTETKIEADFVVFAAGVNEATEIRRSNPSLVRVLRRLAPGYRPPRLRPALIFELESPPGVAPNLEGHLHFVEYGSSALQLEMCSLVPKQGYITVVLVGPGIDASPGPAENKRIIDEFLQLPHVRQLLLPGTRLRTACVCNPRLVIGSARQPFADRVAAIGDMATSRLYKDGILSAHHTASALAETLLDRGVDRRSLQEGYAPTISRFRRDNRFAALVFFLHRVVFSSSVLSRVLYQAVLTERKTSLAELRRLEQILWKIASGDDQYETTFLAMIHPATLWSILSGGLAITLRNYLTECFFRLKWEGFGRFTTGVAKEQLETKRALFRRELAECDVAMLTPLEFERMYTIRIRATCATVLRQLGRFGEADRSYFRPRWVRIGRIQGQANELGCVVRYEVFGRRFSFDVQLERIAEGHLLVYRVRDGFARGGVLLFEVEPASAGHCNLSIYVAFNFARGRTAFTWPLWWCFRRLFPAFVHDVLWNHSLCQLKNIAEAEAPPTTVNQPAPTAG
ncbi:MAG: NAD(P)/FAD-dependent oxidoreductase [Thermoanaerobaculales bacterium]